MCDQSKYDHELYREGVHSILSVDWQLTCRTPLAIRNGFALRYREDTSRAKTRGRDLGLIWAAAVENQGAQSDKENKEPAVSSLAFGYDVEDGKLVPYYVIPSSSVRGALRGWTMRHLLHPDWRSKLVIPKRDDEEKTVQYVHDLVDVLKARQNGFGLIASLFGLAADARPQSESDKGKDKPRLPENAGRLTIETRRFEARTPAQEIASGGLPMHAPARPNNARLQLRVRNPLDRMTHASKDGGLHHFLEICRGETFDIHLSIVNPLDTDLGLLALWRREIDDGMLRLGALSALGRGRLAVTGQRYRLWRRSNAPELQGHRHFQPLEATDAALSAGPDDAIGDDILYGLLDVLALPPAALAHFMHYLEDVLAHSACFTNKSD